MLRGPLAFSVFLPPDIPPKLPYAALGPSRKVETVMTAKSAAVAVPIAAHAAGSLAHTPT